MKIIAEYGRLKPSIASKFGIDTTELKQEIWVADIDLNSIINLTRKPQISYKAIPKYPSTERDISFIISYGIDHSQIIESISHVVSESILYLSLVDEYKGKQVPAGYRSLTYHIVFNHPEKTLTDDEVETVYVSIVNNLKSQWDIQLR